MSVSALAEQTYLPSEESEKVAQVHDFLEARERTTGQQVAPRFLLVGDGVGDQVELPEPVYRALLQVVDALAAGRAVTVAPKSPVMTTQQAADLLGLSRPTVVRLIDEGKIPAERPGARRQVRLADVLAYRDRRRAEQYELLASTAVDLDDEEDPAKAIAELRRVRKDVAARRRRN